MEVDCDLKARCRDQAILSHLKDEDQQMSPLELRKAEDIVNRVSPVQLPAFVPVSFRSAV